MLDSDKHSINTSLIIPSLFDYAPTLGKWQNLRPGGGIFARGGENFEVAPACRRRKILAAPPSMNFQLE